MSMYDIGLLHTASAMHTKQSIVTSINQHKIALLHISVYMNPSYFIEGSMMENGEITQIQTDLK